MIVALAGGTGAAKLLRGLAAVADPARLCVIGNTGDDLEWWGLHVSPDLDSILYALAGVLDTGRGWGIRDDTFHCLEAMGRLGHQTWFNLGDRDLATHLQRTALLRAGFPLSVVMQRIADTLAVGARLHPMSDDRVRTRIRTPTGWLTFQEFFVRDKALPDVLEIVYDGVDVARPAPGVSEAIRDAEAVVICCSNPVTSIGPILAVPGITAALGQAAGLVVAVSPIVAGAPVSGPAAKLLRARGLPVSPLGLLEIYRPWLDVIVLDHRDAGLAPEIERAGVRPVVVETLMTDAAREQALAGIVCDAGGLRS